jgi:hypothetical protein
VVVSKYFFGQLRDFVLCTNFWGGVLGERGVPGLFCGGVRSALFLFACAFVWKIRRTFVSADVGLGDFVGCL